MDHVKLKVGARQARHKAQADADVAAWERTNTPQGAKVVPLIPAARVRSAPAAKSATKSNHVPVSTKPKQSTPPAKEAIKRGQLKAHRFAERYPLMDGDRLDKFVADIRGNGQRDPIILYDGKILDGRNRYRACIELGIEPLFEEFIGNDEEASTLVDSENLFRRHLTDDQIAIRIAELARVKAGRPYSKQSPQNGGTFREAKTKSSRILAEQASKVGISEHKLERVRTILNQGTPEQIEAVRRGAATASETLTKIKEQKQDAFSDHEESRKKYDRMQKKEAKRANTRPATEIRAALISVAADGKRLRAKVDALPDMLLDTNINERQALLSQIEPIIAQLDATCTALESHRDKLDPASEHGHG
jgi:hypothetical protein